MKKKMISLLLCMSMMAGILAGCGGTESGGQGGTPAADQTADNNAASGEIPSEEEAAVSAPAEDVAISAPAEDTEIAMWMLQEVDAYTQSIQASITEFEAENPSVKINLETITADAWYSKVLTAVQSGDLPDIMYLDSINKVSVLRDFNVLEPVDSVIEALGQDEFDPRVLDRYRAEEALWSIPDVVLYQAVYYRKDLFEQQGIAIPTTWDELYEAARKLTIDENADGTPEIYGMAVPLSKNMVCDQTYGHYMYGNGVHVFNPETGEYEFGSKKEQAVEALDFMVQMYEAASPPSSTNWSWSDYRGAFVQGKTAMTPGWGAEIAMAQEENPEILDHIGIFPFPSGPSEEQNPPDTVGDAKSISLVKSEDPDKLDAAKAFCLFLMQPDNLAARAVTRPVFAIPATTSGFNSETYQSNPMVQKFSAETEMLFENVIPYTYRTGGEGGLNPAGGSVEATMIFGDAIHNVLLEDWTAEEAIDWIDEEIQALF